MINNCQIINLVSKYLISILQVMNITFSEFYSNNLITTKCLNTAVMLIIILIGSDNIKSIQQCDVQTTIQRHISQTDNNTNILKTLKKSLYKKHNNSYMYYIMLTDSKISKYNNSNKSEFFPGHVFILEKTITQDYYIYQSFIKQYDLRDFLVKNKCQRYKLKDIKYMCSFFSKFLEKDNVWDNEAVENWNKLTNVDTTKFIGYKTETIYLCFKKFKVKDIKLNILKFINNSLIDIEKNIENNNLDKYKSDNHLYNILSANPYDIKELKSNFIDLKKKII